MNRIAILCNTKDRHSEVALLLQSLRTQTEIDWDLFILDQSQTPLLSCYFALKLINQIKLENHYVWYKHDPISLGVCHARNTLIDEFETFAKEDEYDLVLRLDDDIILEPNYIRKLLEGFKQGYDLMTGVIPSLGMPTMVRTLGCVGDIICEHTFDAEGNLTMKDELAYKYERNVVIDCHQFRTNCLYRRDLHDKIRYPKNLTTVGFREELYFSAQALLEGYKIGAHLNAIAYHLECPSGGVRDADYNRKVALDDETARKWLKKKFEDKGDFYAKI